MGTAVRASLDVVRPIALTSCDKECAQLNFVSRTTRIKYQATISCCIASLRINSQLCTMRNQTKESRNTVLLCLHIERTTFAATWITKSINVETLWFYVSLLIYRLNFSICPQGDTYKNDIWTQQDGISTFLCQKFYYIIRITIRVMLWPIQRD